MYRRGLRLWLPMTLALLGLLVSSTAMLLATPCAAACRGSECHQARAPRTVKADDKPAPAASAAGGCHGAHQASTGGSQSPVSASEAPRAQPLASVSAASCCAGTDAVECAPQVRLEERQSAITSPRDWGSLAAIEPARTVIPVAPPPRLASSPPPPLVRSTPPPTRTVVLLL